MKLAAILLTTAMLFGSGCFSKGGSKGIPEDIVQFSENRVYMLEPETRQGNGSGLLVSPHIMITACHVAKAHKRMVGTNSRNVELLLERVSCDEERDIAVLKVLDEEKPQADPLFMALTPPRAGATVYGAGHPLGMPLIITQGHWQRELEDTGKRIAYLVTAPTINGDSGSPLMIYEDGEVKVVGIRVAVKVMPLYGMGMGGIASPLPHITLVVPSEEVYSVIRESTREE